MTTTSQRVAGSYIEWAPIIAGAILACAISAVLLQFGGALGLTVAKVLDYTGENLVWRIIVIALWLLWVQLISSLLGAYIAGRMREPVIGATPHESEVRDGTHGLMVWATSTLLMVVAVTVGSFLTTIAAAHGVVVNNSDIEMTADLTRKSGIILGFAMAASSLVSAVAAWWAGTVGGDHRDTSLDLSRFFSFKNRR